MKTDEIKCFLCDFGWILLLILAIALTLFFTRTMWLPSIFQVDPIPEIDIISSPTVVQPVTATQIPTNTMIPIPVVTVTKTQIIETAPIEGAKAPDFIARNFSGETVRLSSFFGKPILLVAFGAGCPHCQHEAPGLQIIYEEFHEDDLEIIAVNAWNEFESEVQRFQETYGLEFPVLLDPNGEFSTLYEIEGVPTNIFINSQGVITQIISGSLDESGLREVVINYLLH